MAMTTRDLRARIEWVTVATSPKAIAKIYLGDEFLTSVICDTDEHRLQQERKVGRLNQMVGGRITELLEANNAEVFRRRDLTEEVAYWRRDAIARLQGYIATHESGHLNEDQQAALRVRHILPTLAALRDADLGAWFDRCPYCGEFLRPGDQYVLIGHEYDHERWHYQCSGRPVTATVLCEDNIFRETEPDAAEVIAQAKKITYGEDDDGDAAEPTPEQEGAAAAGV